MATGNDLVEGEAREQVVAMSADGERVTAVSSVRVAPGAAEDFRALHEELLVELATSPGFLRCDLFEPVPGVQEDTVVVLAFDTRANLDRWLHSDERRRILEQMDQYTEGDRTLNVVGGFAGWFAPDRRRTREEVEVGGGGPAGTHPDIPRLHRRAPRTVPRPGAGTGDDRRQRHRHRRVDVGPHADHHRSPLVVAAALIAPRPAAVTVAATMTR